MLKPRLLFLLITLVAFATNASAEDYFPPRGVWEQRPPTQLGFDAARLNSAVDYALAHESTQNRDTAADLKATFGMREPDYRIMGPTKPWAAMCGIIIKDGYVAAQWGPVNRVDMTHSVVKTFLTTTVGVAWDQGLIRDVHDRVGPYMPDADLFASEHKAPITWDHLLRQTSTCPANSGAFRIGQIVPSVKPSMKCATVRCTRPAPISNTTTCGLIYSPLRHSTCDANPCRWCCATIS